MQIKEYLSNKKNFYEVFCAYIEREDESKDELAKLKEYISSNKNNKNELLSFLNLLQKYITNHHCDSFLSRKVEQIIKNYFKEIKQSFSNFEIFSIFKDNKKIILFLLKEGIITIDEYVFSAMLNRKETNGVNYCHFFYPELKNQFSKKDEISIDPELLDNYENKREIGQNDSYICRLIRQDLIEEFIKYTTQAGYNLSSFICHSIFETNVYLLKKEDISLIEYAAFFGSILIIKYLVAKGVELTTSLWLYSIHSNNPDLIHFLEESHLKLDEDLFDECIKESIKCHHNNFANYFITNRKNEIESLNDALPFFDEPDDHVCKAVIPFAFRYNNYEFMPDSIDDNDLFLYACKYNHVKIVEFLLNQKKVDIKFINEIFIAFCLIIHC